MVEGKPADCQANWMHQVRKRVIVLIDLHWTPGKPLRGPHTSLRKEQYGLKMTTQIHRIMIISFSAYSFIITAGIEIKGFIAGQEHACWELK